DLLVAGGLEDDVELVLLLGRGRTGVAAACGRRTGGRDGDRGGGGDLEGLLEGLDELGQLDEGHLLEVVKELLGAQLRHDGVLSLGAVSGVSGLCADRTGRSVSSRRHPRRRRWVPRPEPRRWCPRPRPRTP